jgi:membrane fusion protein, multidrug efflux system
VTLRADDNAPKAREIATLAALRKNMRSLMKSSVISFAPLSLAFLGLAILTACDKQPPAPAEIRPVRTVTAVAHAEGESVSVTGEIRARTEESLAFRVDGRMIARQVDVGQEVRTNDLIAELDPEPLRDALRTAQATLGAAQAALQESTKNVERQRVLNKELVASGKTLDAAERAFQTAKANLDSAAAQQHDAEDRLGYTQLRADAPGFVIATGAEAGEVVRAGQTIVTVAQQGGVDAVFDVPATLIRQVSPDALITVSLSDDPSVRTTGRARELAPQADPVTRSFRVKVGLTERPEAMRLGATVIGRTNMQATEGIELPATSLTIADDKPALWVVDPKSMEVSLRSVELLRQGSSSIVVSRGLEGGELIVTAGVHALRPGQKVRLLGSSS